MRMRRKKHLSERADNISDYIIPVDRTLPPDTSLKISSYSELPEKFASAPVILEIGSGKGRFALQYAAAHPESCVIGVEKCMNVLVAACETLKESGLDNLLFMHCGAEYLNRYLRPASVGGIFLNFSCPFPKNHQASHRLTDGRFLKIYEELLIPGGCVSQKTDNAGLFEYSIEQFSLRGWKLTEVTVDLHSSRYAEGNIMTEYEERFTSQGAKIYSLKAYPPEKSEERV